MSAWLLVFSREEGIRTLDALLEHTHFPGVRLRPLGHLSKLRAKIGFLSGYKNLITIFRHVEKCLPVSQS